MIPRMSQEDKLDRTSNDWLPEGNPDTITQSVLTCVTNANGAVAISGCTKVRGWRRLMKLGLVCRY